MLSSTCSTDILFKHCHETHLLYTAFSNFYKGFFNMKNVTDFKAKVLEKVSKDEAEKAVKIILKYIGETP